MVFNILHFYGNILRIWTFKNWVSRNKPQEFRRIAHNSTLISANQFWEKPIVWLFSAKRWVSLETPNVSLALLPCFSLFLTLFFFIVSTRLDISLFVMHSSSYHHIPSEFCCYYFKIACTSENNLEFCIQINVFSDSLGIWDDFKSQTEHESLNPPTTNQPSSTFSYKNTSQLQTCTEFLTVHISSIESIASN